jgi:hypothetical protein
MLWKLTISLVLLLSTCAPAFAGNASDPVVYPDGGTVTVSPILFFWPDDRTDPSKKLTFMLTLSEGKGSSVSHSFVPSASDDFMFFQLPYDLPAGKYRYRIDADLGKKPYRNEIFGYLKYPISGGFEIVGELKHSSDTAENIIRSYRANHYNLLVNGYNGLFYGGSAIVSGAAAYLLFTVFDFNIVTRVIGYIAAGSAVTGAGLSGYYTYRYVSFDEKNWRPEKSASPERNVTISLSGSF